METEFRLEAYHKWLIRESGKDRELLAGIVKLQAGEQQEMAWGLIERIGDEVVTNATFFRIADFLLKADQR